MKELRLLKRVVDNEIGDLKERETKRICHEKQDGQEKVAQAAELAQGSVQMVEIMDKDELEKAYKAQKKVIQERAKAERAAKRRANPKAKGKAKGKAKAKDGEIIRVEAEGLINFVARKKPLSLISLSLMT